MVTVGEAKNTALYTVTATDDKSLILPNCSELPSWDQIQTLQTVARCIRHGLASCTDYWLSWIFGPIVDKIQDFFSNYFWLKNKEIAPDCHYDPILWITLLVQTQVNLRFKLKHKITGRQHRNASTTVVVKEHTFRVERTHLFIELWS